MTTIPVTLCLLQFEKRKIILSSENVHGSSSHFNYRIVAFLFKFFMTSSFDVSAKLGKAIQDQPPKLPCLAPNDIMCHFVYVDEKWGIRRKSIPLYQITSNCVLKYQLFSISHDSVSWWDAPPLIGTCYTGRRSKVTADMYLAVVMTISRGTLVHLHAASVVQTPGLVALCHPRGAFPMSKGRPHRASYGILQRLHKYTSTTFH